MVYVPPKCPHGKRKYYCRPCKGGAFCIHDREKAKCKDCKGSGICKHEKIKHRCKICKGESICKHEKRKDICKICNSSTFCEHGKRKYRCKTCKGTSICEHEKLKANCIKCKGTNICKHEKRRDQCKICMKKFLCPHDKFKAKCKKCKGSSYCVHEKVKRICKKCKGSSICKHEKQISQCAPCGGSRVCPNCINWIDARIGCKNYDGYCATCFKRLFPNDPRSKVIYEHTKEIRVRNEINEYFSGFVHDKPLYTGNCNCTHRRRIDHRRLINNTIIAIETDEHAHKRYSEEDEEIRYDDLYMIHSGKWIFIRFNPDNTKDHKEDLEDRLAVLIDTIDKQIDRIEDGINTELVEIIKLYY